MSGFQEFGQYNIYHANSNQVCDVFGGHPNNNVRVHAWEQNNGQNQRWEANSEGDFSGFFFLTSVASDGTRFVLDASESALGQAIVWEFHWGVNQKWKSEPVESNPGLFYILNNWSGLYLQFNGNGNALSVAPKSNSDNQWWSLKQVGTDNSNWVSTLNYGNKASILVQIQQAKDQHEKELNALKQKREVSQAEINVLNQQSTILEREQQLIKLEEAYYAKLSADQRAAEEAKMKARIEERKRRQAELDALALIDPQRALQERIIWLTQVQNVQEQIFITVRTNPTPLRIIRIVGTSSGTIVLK